MSNRSAIVLLSGGLDSATTLEIARSQGFELLALTFRYGQRHDMEVGCAENIVRNAQVREHRVIELDPGVFGKSALTSDEIPIPKGRGGSIGAGIPSTYVPARNTLFLSYALAWADSCGALDLFIGVNAVDYSGYPDCRPEYIESFERMANLATRSGVEGWKITIHAPLISLTKAEIVKKGMELGVDFSLTTTCYDPDPAGAACGECDACVLRLAGFEAAGVADPITYR